MIILLVFFLLLVSYTDSKGKIFSPEGKWMYSMNSDKECIQLHLCSPYNLTWYPNYAIKQSNSTETSIIQENKPVWTTYDSVTGCNALRDKNIKSVYLQGDSYIRHMLTGLILILSGNYKNGSFHPIFHAGRTGCDYEKQFLECAHKEDYIYRDVGKLCNGSVQFILNDFSYETPTRVCSNTEKTVVVFSYGNHRPFGGHGLRWGINDPEVWKSVFEDPPFCPAMRTVHNNLCSVYWMSTHHRQSKSRAHDESYEQIHIFNKEMREFFESENCTNFIGYIDVYNMTSSLSINHSIDASSMSYDGYHWGMEVNLIKANILLNTILQEHPSSS